MVLLALEGLDYGLPLLGVEPLQFLLVFLLRFDKRLLFLDDRGLEFDEELPVAGEDSFDAKGEDVAAHEAVAEGGERFRLDGPQQVRLGVQLPQGVVTQVVRHEV